MKCNFHWATFTKINSISNSTFHQIRTYWSSSQPLKCNQQSKNKLIFLNGLRIDLSRFSIPRSQITDKPIVKFLSKHPKRSSWHWFFSSFSFDFEMWWKFGLINIKKSEKVIILFQRLKKIWFKDCFSTLGFID